MLYALVMEREEKIKSLLDVNGLRPINYWMATLVYYFILFNVVSLAFYVIGYLFVDLQFFRDTSAIVIIVFLVGWNVAQIGLSVLFAVLLRSSNDAICNFFTSNFSLWLHSGGLWHPAFLFNGNLHLPQSFHHALCTRTYPLECLCQSILPYDCDLLRQHLFYQYRDPHH